MFVSPIRSWLVIVPRLSGGISRPGLAFFVVMAGLGPRISGSCVVAPTSPVLSAPRGGGEGRSGRDASPLSAPRGRRGRVRWGAEHDHAHPRPHPGKTHCRTLSIKYAAQTNRTLVALCRPSTPLPAQPKTWIAAGSPAQGRGLGPAMTTGRPVTRFDADQGPVMVSRAWDTAVAASRQSAPRPGARKRRCPRQ
jgi:hypothetical protein